MRRQDQFPAQPSDLGRTLAIMRRDIAERAAGLVPRLRRAAGTTAATLGTSWSWYDRSGSEVLAEDATAWGLRRPWLPIPMTSPVTFVNTSWSTVFRGTWQVQHPVILAEFSLTAPGATTCQARLMLDTGGTPVQLGSTLTASAADAAASFTVDPTAHGLAFGQSGSLLLQVQRTAGTGTCTVWNKGLWARQS